MIGQAQAVTGRKPKRRYVDIINARTPYLPGLYAAKENRAYREEMTGLEEDRLELDRQRVADEEERAKKQLKLQEEQGKQANTLGMINLGLTGGLGYMKNKTMKDIFTPDAGGKIASGGGSPTAMGITPGVTPGTISPTTSLGSKIGGALTTPGTYGYGGLGYAGGKLIGGKDKWKSGLAGAGIGFGLNMLSGGSITSSIISGLLGGGGGYFG